MQPTQPGPEVPQEQQAAAKLLWQAGTRLMRTQQARAQAMELLEDQILTAYREGIPIRRISIIAGVTRPTVHAILVRAGVRESVSG